MTLSHKTLLVIVSTSFALMCILAVASDLILLNSYSELERRVLRDNQTKVRNRMNGIFDELETAARDFSGSSQVAVSTARYLDSLGISTMINHRVNVILYGNSSGGIEAFRGCDYGKAEFVSLRREHVNLLSKALIESGKSPNSRLHGVVMLEELPLMIAVVPFTARPDDGRVMMAGRFLDKEEIARLSLATGFPLEITPINSGAQPQNDFKSAFDALKDGTPFFSSPMDSSHIAGYFLQKDIMDSPAFILRMLEKRILYEHGKISIAYLVTAMVFCGVIFCGVMLVFIRNSVLRRLAYLSHDVGEITRKQDITRRLEISGYDELGGLAGSINTMLDSLSASETALRESEEQYRNLFERAPDPVLIIGLDGDETGRITAANAMASQQHGYTVEELCSMRLLDITAQETKGVVDEVIGGIRRGKWITTELTHIRKDGSRFPVELHAGPVLIRRRNYILAFERDISERKRAQDADLRYMEQIGRLNEDLARHAGDFAAANEELEAFNYSVSHDMRGPLTRICAYCQMMLDDAGSVEPEQRRYLEKINEAGIWLNEMIDSMLDLSKLSRQDLVTEPVDLSRMVEDIIAELRGAEPGRSVEMRIKKGLVSDADPSLMRVLMTNLLGNAWKYTADRENAVIEFGGYDSGEVPVFFVRDNGIGFDMAHADNIFRTFSRLHDDSVFKGSGIGLATVFRIVKRHGGRVWAQSEPGYGATFFFTLTQSSRKTRPDRRGSPII